MQTYAVLKYAKFSPQKGRLVADQVRGLAVGPALNLLTYSPKRAAKVIKKVLESAIANAENNLGANVDLLKISKIHIDEGPRLKRMLIKAKGRGDRLVRRMCHITVNVSDQVKEVR